jgi:hypothetical protein
MSRSAGMTKAPARGRRLPRSVSAAVVPVAAVVAAAATATAPESAARTRTGKGRCRQLLDEFGADADDAVAAFDLGLARGTPGDACWSAQKDASASRSRYMMAPLIVDQPAGR